MTTNFDVLEKAERLELLAAELYGELARHFSEDPVAAKLFTRLRYEEQQHATRLRMLVAQSRHDRRLLGKIEADTGALDAVTQETSSMIAEVRRGSWGLDLSATRQALVDLEERCARAHVEGLDALHESLRRFFAQLAAQDKAHEELLRG